MEEELKETLTEVRALNSKALRRMQRFDEAYDNMFYEKLKTHEISRQELAKFRMRKANDVINPDKKYFSKFKWYLEMADFNGNGKVTVKEFHLFMLCYGVSMGLVVPTGAPGLGFERVPS